MNVEPRALALLVVFALGLGPLAPAVFAQEKAPELENLKKQMLQMEEQLRLLRQKVEQLEAKPPTPEAPPPSEKTDAATEQELKALEAQVQQQRAASRGILAPFNPKISLNGLFSAAMFSKKDNLNFGDHDPNVQGFKLQNGELHLQGIVDPYLQMDSNIVLTIDKGDTKVELEELYG